MDLTPTLQCILPSTDTIKNTWKFRDLDVEDTNSYLASSHSSVCSGFLLSRLRNRVLNGLRIIIDHWHNDLTIGKQ